MQEFLHTVELESPTYSHTHGSHCLA